MKKSTKLMCGILGLGLLAAGCSSISPVKNNYSEIIYNGAPAVMVDGHLYYGNSFADSTKFTSNKDYDKAAADSYLARLNTNIDLVSKTKDYTPKGLEKIRTDVVSHSKSFTFALGNYIYYTTPKTEKDKEGKNYFNFTTLYRMKTDGSKRQIVCTTDGEIKNIEALKFNGSYYIVILAGTDLQVVKIGNKIEKMSVIKDVTSIAVPKTYQKDKVGSSLDWNGYIFFTVEKKDDSNPDLKGTIVKRVKVGSEDVEVVAPYNMGKTINFLAREKDVLFYNIKDGEEGEVYVSDLTEDDKIASFSNKRKLIYSGNSISNVNLIASAQREYGYIFMTESNNLLFSTKDFNKIGKVSLLNNNEALSGYKVLNVSGRKIYVSTTTNIFEADLSQIFDNNVSGPATTNLRSIVKMTAIYDGSLSAMDDKYIYYYAKLEKVESEDKNDANDETDDNYYMYRVRINSAIENDYQLLGNSNIAWRTTKD